MLTLPTFLYERETWTVIEEDKLRKTSKEILFMRGMAKYTLQN